MDISFVSFTETIDPIEVYASALCLFVADIDAAYHALSFFYQKRMFQ